MRLRTFFMELLYSHFGKVAGVSVGVVASLVVPEISKDPEPATVSEQAEEAPVAKSAGRFPSSAGFSKPSQPVNRQQTYDESRHPDSSRTEDNSFLQGSESSTPNVVASGGGGFQNIQSGGFSREKEKSAEQVQAAEPAASAEAGTGSGGSANSTDTGTSTETSTSTAIAVNLDVTVPTAPTSLSITQILPSLSPAPTLTWTDGTDEVAISEHQLRILRTSDSAVITDWAAATSGTYRSGDGLVSGTQYTFQVRAVDTSGNSSTSLSGNWTATGYMHEDFSGSFSTDRYTPYAGFDSAIFQILAGTGVFSPPSNTVPVGGFFNTYYGFSSMVMDFRGWEASVKVNGTLSVLADWDGSQSLYVSDGATSSFLSIGVTRNTIVFESNVAGASSQTTMAYVAATHRYWRIRHNTANDNIYWDTSADGTTWTTRRNMARPIAITAATVDLDSGVYVSVNNPGSATYDDLKIEAGINAFTITGATGGTDVIPDASLTNGTTVTANWNAAGGGTATYDVTIYESDGVTVKCATQNTAATTYTFAGCALTGGASYQIDVNAKTSAGTTRRATNNLFSFSL